MTETKKCSTCKNAIPPDAKKCTSCGSFQDFRSYLNFSGTVLGLLVALISVVTFSIPVWQKVFWQPTIKVESSLFDVNQQGIATVSVSNGSNVPIAIETAIIGSKTNTLKFNLDSISPENRIVHSNSIGVYKIPLRVRNEEQSTDVQDLVLLFQQTALRNKFCTMQLDAVTTDGEYRAVNPDAKTRGLDVSEEKKCPLKLKKLILNTFTKLAKNEEYLESI